MHTTLELSSPNF